jgi:Kef-type K+ transport system membrane component KefB
MTITANIATHKTEALLFFTLLQLTVIVLAARIGGGVALRIGQSAVVGEIVIGILLGPSLFGLIAPDVFQYVFHSGAPEPMQMLSQIGLVLLMFQIGLEFDFAHLGTPRNRKAVIWIATASLIAPFALGFAVGQISAPILSPGAHPLGSALFVATAFSITALPILGRIMMEFGMTRTPIGVIAISAAAINDVIGWLLLALITTLTLSNFDAPGFALKVVLVLGFFVLSWFAVRPVMKRILHRCDAHSGALSHNLLGIVLAAIFLSAMTTYQLGIFAIFGGFMMGVLLHDEHAFVRTWKARISPAQFLYLHRPAHQYRQPRYARGLELVRAYRRPRHARQIRRCLSRRPCGRDESQRRQSHGYHDEHPRAYGADRDQRRLRPWRDLAADVHHSGHHGDFQHRGDVAPAAPLAAAHWHRRAITLGKGRALGTRAARVSATAS